MSGQPRPTATYAVLPPAMAYVLLREHPEALAAIEAKARRLTSSGQDRVGRDLLEGAAQVRQSARSFAVRREAAAEHGPERERGTSEPPQASAGAGSCRPPDPGLTTGQAAERFRAAGLPVSERAIRYMVTGARGPVRLSAVLEGGRYLVDAVSVEAEIDRRSGT